VWFVSQGSTRHPRSETTATRQPAFMLCLNTFGALGIDAFSIHCFFAFREGFCEHSFLLVGDCQHQMSGRKGGIKVKCLMSLFDRSIVRDSRQPCPCQRSCFQRCGPVKVCLFERMEADERSVPTGLVGSRDLVYSPES
jgi:hypothetical protein